MGDPRLGQARKLKAEATRKCQQRPLVMQCSQMEALPRLHPWHLLRSRPCSQMAEPPQLWHLLLSPPCSQMEPPPQLLHRLLLRLCSQMPAFLSTGSSDGCEGTHCRSEAYSLRWRFFLVSVIHRPPALAAFCPAALHMHPMSLTLGMEPRVGGGRAGWQRERHKREVTRLRRCLLSDKDETISTLVAADKC